MKPRTKDRLILFSVVSLILAMFAIFILTYEDAEGVAKPRILRTNDPVVLDNEFQRVYDELQRLSDRLDSCACP